MDITEDEWARYILDSPLFMELQEDDVELLQRILAPNETNTTNTEEK